MLVFSQLRYSTAQPTVKKLIVHSSLGRISVAMVTVFKNFTTIAITVGDRILFANPITGEIWLSLLIMVRACVVTFKVAYSDRWYAGDR